MDFLSGFASSIARDLVCGGVHQLRYPCCFDNLVDDLQREHDKVVQTRNNVQKRIDDDRKQTRETAASVHAWLNEANTDIGNVEELLEKARTKKSCCFGQFPNWIWRYRVGRQLAKSTKTVTKWNEEGSKYIQFERLISLPGLQYYSSERCLRFKSRQSAHDQLMKALKGDEVNMIGLYGMGGCGKTTLAIEVGKRAKEDKLFKEVPFVTVSSTVDVTRIQEEIASSLRYNFPEPGEKERAQRLHDRLIKEEKVLVILDNVWQRLDFEAIGIPSSEIHKGCKVLITTRSEDVCKGMDCQRMIPLSVLTDEEAWDLFQKQAHISEATSENLKHLARQISDGCKGLPVAIAAVASTLKGKAEEQWKVALNRLKNSKPVHIEKGLEDPYKCLQLSYDNLDIEEAKSLFLLCSVFPEEYEIPIEDLTRFAIGLGLIGGVHSYEEARNEVCAAKTKLISSCLLLDVGDGKDVKMHDLVRQVAHYIAKNEGKGIKCALKKDVTVEYASPRYLWIEEFPCQLDCSNLEFLCISTYGEVLDEIFQGMKKLRVLFIVQRDSRRIRPLSTKSFKSLTNLRCLLLENWKLGGISFLVDMKKLESLALRRCSFLELPDVVVTQLSNLRLLDLSGSKMEKTHFEMIGRDSRLEELYIDDCRSELNLYDETTAEFFSKINIRQSLQRYHIQLGSQFRFYRGKLLNSPKTLVLSCFDPLNVAVKDLAEEAEVLCIGNIQGGAKNIIPDIFQLDGRGMNELIELRISNSEDIEHLVETGNHMSQVGNLFSKLRMLRIEQMVHLRSLYHGLPPDGLFEKLEELWIKRCPELHGTLFVSKLNLCNLKVLSLDGCSKLTSLFTLAVARSLEQLEELDIYCCDGLKHIIADDDNKEEISSDDHRLVFPKLKRLTVRSCNKLEYIIPVTYAQGLLQLEELDIFRCDGLKHIIADDDNKEEISSDDHKLVFPKLKQLTVSHCDKLEYIIPVTYAQGLLQLEELDISQCDGLKHIIADDDNKEETSSDDHMLVFPELKRLTVEECKKLEYIIPVTYAQGLLQLERLEIKDDPQLKYVFGQCKHGGQLDNHQSQNEFKIEFPLLEKLTLADLPNIISMCPENCYPACPSLCQLILQDCPEVAIVSINTYLFGSKETQCDHNTTEIRKNCRLLKVEAIKNRELTGFFELGGQSIDEEQDSLTMYLEMLSHTYNGLLQSMNLINPEQMEVNEKFQRDKKILKLHFEYNQLEDFPEITSIPSAPLVNYYSGPFTLCNLKRLLLRSCSTLRMLFSPSTAICLTSLEELIIDECHELRYLFGQCKHGGQLDNHQSQNELKIELPLLDKLTLDHLPNIISIFPENCYLACPSLSQFDLRHCPEVAMVSINTCMFGSKEIQCDHNTTQIRKNCLLLGVGAIKNHELKGIFELGGQSIDEEQDSLTMCLEMLSHTCNGLVQSMNLLNPEEMKVNEEFEGGKKILNLYLAYNQLEDFPEITSIPSAPLVNYYSGPFTLCNLKRLILRSCSMLRTLFSPSTAICLTSLEELFIDECHEFRYLVTYGSTHKEIIQEDHHDSQSHALMLPRLEMISVKNCRSLEYIFHVSYAQDLVKLKEIKIEMTHSLIYVFGHSIDDNNDAHSSHQYQNKIQIELPVLESIKLLWIPNMINICPDNYYLTCSCLQRIIMDIVGLSTHSVNNLMVHSDHSSASGKEATSMTNGQLIGSVDIRDNSKIKGIFHLDELPFDRPQATSWLTDLELDDLPELNYIWKGAKHSVTLQNLKLLDIWGCGKLKIIFSSPVSRSLPQLKILRVLKCEGLEKIIEDDDEEHESVSNRHESPKISFLKLKLLIVSHCNNLKRLFHVSTSHEFPELEHLILNENPHFEQVFEGVEVLLSKLKHVILVQLPNLINVSQWIELQTVTNLFVHNCPKLPLTSTTTVEDLLQSYSSHDKEINTLVRLELSYISDVINEETVEKDRMLQMTSQLDMNPENQTASGSEHNQIESGATESHEVLNKGTQDSPSLEHKLSSHNLTEGIKEIETTTTGKVPVPVKPAVPTCDPGQTRESTTSLPTTLHKIPSRKLVDQQTTGEPSFMGQQYELGETIVTAEDAQISIIPPLDGKNVQEGSTSEDATKAALPASTEGNNGFGGVVVTHTEPNGEEMLAQHSQLVKQGDKLNEDEIGTTLCQKIKNVDLNLMDKEGEIGVVSNDSIQVPSETAEKVHMPQTTSQFEMDLEYQIASGSDHNQIESGATESHEVLNTGTQDSPSLELKLSSHYSTKSITETETASTRKVPAPVKPTLPIGDSGLPRESKTSLPTTLHKIPSRGKNVQEGSTSEDATKAALPASTEGNSGFGGVVVTHTEPNGGEMLAQYSQLVKQGDKLNEDEIGTTPCQKIKNVDDNIQEGLNLIDEEGEIGVVSIDIIEVPSDTSGSHSLIIAKLGAYKHLVDMDDAQIALLAEAIEVYPHLWNVCEKFSESFQALMLKTLIDILLFLRNESAVSVTPQRVNEFHILCDVALQLGFERSWVDRMRQRVTIRDPTVDHAQEQLSELLKRQDHAQEEHSELLKRQDQLTQELHKIKDEIHGLNDFVDAQKKCFDFL